MTCKDTKYATDQQKAVKTSHVTDLLNSICSLRMKC